MNARISLIAILGASILWACNRNKIMLEKVSDLPGYFTASKHFGKDIKSMEELNEFIVVTGMIDTSESVPLRQAVITIGRVKIYLDLKKTGVDNRENSEKYSGKGYELDIVYKEKKHELYSTFYEGHLEIRHNDEMSEYKIVGTAGYN